MERMQILFSKPQINRLRSIAKSQDRPVSELIRTAVDFWLFRYGDDPGSTVSEEPPVYSCGAINTDPGDLRQIANEDRGIL